MRVDRAKSLQPMTTLQERFDRSFAVIDPDQGRARRSYGEGGAS